MNSEKLMEHDETFESLNNRNVKDLYWLLFSQCPINNDHPTLRNIPLFPEEILMAWKSSTVEYFLKLDQRADDLTHFIDRPKNKRLGFYAEALLSFFFQTYSEIELLLQNHQVVDNKTTLGEVDFIIKWKNRVIHLECAVKFYLCNHTKDVNDLTSWIGPACKDNLGRKIEKVKDHQLPMIDSPVFRDIFRFDKVESYLFLKGKFYVKNKVHCDWVKYDLLGNYASLNEIENNNELRLLVKPFWMSVHWEENESRYSKVFDKKILNKRAELVTKKGIKPMFVIPENWPF